MGYFQKYASYDDLRERKDLSINPWTSWYGIPADGATGRRLYEKMPQERYPYFAERTPGANYINSNGQKTLPDHSSRFGYNNGCPNGYCTGPFPGKYAISHNSPNSCNLDLVPNMAPKRFYDAFFSNPNKAYTQAEIDYRNIMDGTNYQF